MKNQTKERLDNYLVAKGFFGTKNQAQGAILSGKVKINGEILTKAGTQIKTEENLEIEIEQNPYVSRGAFKLEKAVKEFNIAVENKICLDIGASTGGFTDFLLQNGAKKVYAVDVGYGQLAWNLRNDPKVVVIERTNVRNATPEDIYKDIDTDYAQLTVVDVSFISITKILANIKALMSPQEQEIILLIKPQFEAGKEQVPKSGVVKDKNIHIEVIEKIFKFAEEIGLSPVNLTYSPIKGRTGNIEYLACLSNNKTNCGKINTLVSEVVQKAHENLNKSKLEE